MTRFDVNNFAKNCKRLFVAHGAEEAKELEIVDVHLCLDFRYCDLTLRTTGDVKSVVGYSLPVQAMGDLIDKGGCCFRDSIYIAKTLLQLYKMREEHKETNNISQVVVVDETPKEQDASVPESTITFSTSFDDVDEKLAEAEKEQKEKAKSLQLQCVELLDCVVAVRWLAPRNVTISQKLDTLSTTLTKVETWGLLVNVYDDCIAVAQNVSEQDNEREYPSELQNITVIPLVCVKNIQQVINIEEDE